MWCSEGARTLHDLLLLVIGHRIRCWAQGHVKNVAKWNLSALSSFASNLL